MSFTNKCHGRGEYITRSNSNPNKIQTMNYHNPLTIQHSNGSNSEVYGYEEKSQHSTISPKVVLENHGMLQHSTSPRDPSYPYKNNNGRIKQYQTNKSYNNKHVNYYSQNSTSSAEIIPEIEHLREFVKEQTDRFKMEFMRHENHKTDSPSPNNYQYNDQMTYKYNKPCASLCRSSNGFPMSYSVGSISNNNDSVIPVSPTCSDNTNRHQDVRLISQQNSFTVTKNNTYNKYLPSSQFSGKPSPSLARNLSYDETSKSPNIMKMRNDSPNNNNPNVDKHNNMKNQFPSPTGSSGGVGRQDIKKSYNKSTKSVPYSTGSNLAIHQENQNNNVGNDSRRNDQQSVTTRPMPNLVPRISGAPTKLNNKHRGYSNHGRYDNNCNGIEAQSNYRAVVSVEAYPGRRPGPINVINCQDIGDSYPSEQFFSPEVSGSPSSTTRSSPESNNVVASHSQARQH